MIIKECLSEEEIKSTFLVMKQLRPKLEDEIEYLKLILQLKETEGYRLVALFDETNNDKCIAVTGFRIKCCLFSNGKPEIYVDDLVTDTEIRSKGYGSVLFAWLRKECKRLDCAGIQLDSGTQRVQAHKFYEREGMKSTALHFYREKSPERLINLQQYESQNITIQSMPINQKTNTSISQLNFSSLKQSAIEEKSENEKEFSEQFSPIYLQNNQNKNQTNQSVPQQKQNNLFDTEFN